MKIKNLVKYIVITSLLVPLLGFVSYIAGFYVNTNFIYTLLLLVVIFVFSNIKKTKREKYYFVILAIPIIFNFLLSLVNDGFVSGILNGLKIFKNYYLVFFIGFIIYKIYYLREEIDEFYRLIIYIGVFIASFNLILAFDNYIHFLGLANTINGYIHTHHTEYVPYLSFIGIKRPIGYFYDLHSQTFIPMASLFLLLLKTTTIKYQKISIAILLISILVSSVRMSYAMLVIFGVFVFLMKKQKLTTWGFLVIILAGMFGYFAEYIIMFFDQVRGVRGESVNIAVNHLLTIPLLLWDESTITFFFGGNSSYRSLIYSEVYLWTLLFYIGIVGLVFYILPLFTIFNFEKYNVGLFFSLYLIASLLHYKVYNTGVNVFVSAIGIIYMFDMLNKIHVKRS